MPMSNASMNGAQPPTTGVAEEADGAAPSAPMDMGAACVEATAAVAHCESEAGKVAMGGVL